MKITMMFGSPHLNGTTNALAEQFIRGAQEVGQEVTRLDLGRMKIGPCLACDYCSRTKSGCVQKDDMPQVEQAVREADLIVLVTPLYYYGMSAQLKEQAPKVLFANAVETAHNSILIGDLAKIIRQNGVDIGQKRLFEWLRQNGYLIKDGQSKNMPTQKAMEMSLFEVKESTINNPDGSVRITRTTKVTGKGQTYFVKKFLS